MSGAHTQGRWSRNIPPARKYATIFAGRNTHVCHLATQGLSDAEIEANCNLIVAAPLLLAACNQALAVFGNAKAPRHKAARLQACEQLLAAISAAQVQS